MLKYHGQRDGVSSWASLVTPPTPGVRVVSPSIRMDGWGGGGTACQMPQPAEVSRALAAVRVALRRTQEGGCSWICRRSAPPPRQPVSANLSGAGCVQGTVSRAFHLLALETPLPAWRGRPGHHTTHVSEPAISRAIGAPVSPSQAPFAGLLRPHQGGNQPPADRRGGFHSTIPYADIANNT